MLRIRLMLLVVALGFFGLGMAFAQRRQPPAEQPAASEEKAAADNEFRISRQVHQRTLGLFVRLLLP